MLIFWAVLGGFVLDPIFADPAWLPHPVVLMGRCISALEKRLRAALPVLLRSSIIEPRPGVQVLFAVNPIDADCVKAPAFTGRGTRALIQPAPYGFISRAHYD